MPPQSGIFGIIRLSTSEFAHHQPECVSARFLRQPDVNALTADWAICLRTVTWLALGSLHLGLLFWLGLVARHRQTHWFAMSSVVYFSFLA